MKTLLENENTCMTPFIMALRSILCLYCVTSLVERCLLQGEATRSHQNTVCFNIVKEKRDFTFGPSAASTCLLSVFGADWSIVG